MKTRSNSLLRRNIAQSVHVNTDVHTHWRFHGNPNENRPETAESSDNFDLAGSNSAFGRFVFEPFP